MNPIETKLDLQMKHVNLLLSKWMGLGLTYAGYYDIKNFLQAILPPCQGDCASLLAVFFCFWFGVISLWVNWFFLKIFTP